jgi:hypothetical protein
MNKKYPACLWKHVNLACIAKPADPGRRTIEGYVLRGSDQRARASMRVQAIGVFVSYVTAGVIESVQSVSAGE